MRAVESPRLPVVIWQNLIAQKRKLVIRQLQLRMLCESKKLKLVIPPRPEPIEPERPGIQILVINNHIPTLLKIQSFLKNDISVTDKNNHSLIENVVWNASSFTNAYRQLSKRQYDIIFVNSTVSAHLFLLEIKKQQFDPYIVVVSESSTFRESATQCGAHEAWKKFESFKAIGLLTYLNRKGKYFAAKNKVA